MARSLNQTRKKKHMAEKKAASYPTEVELPPSVTVKELAELFGREVSEIIKHLMMDGVMATINQNLDRDTIEILAEEFGVTLQPLPPVSFAKNDIGFHDPTGVDHDALGGALKKAIYNYMHGIGLEEDVRSWFPFKVPKTTVARNRIERALRERD